MIRVHAKKGALYDYTRRGNKILLLFYSGFYALGSYSKYPLCELFIMGKPFVFPQVQKYVSTLGNTQYFPWVTNSYSGYFEYTPSCAESLAELLLDPVCSKNKT